MSKGDVSQSTPQAPELSPQDTQYSGLNDLFNDIPEDVNSHLQPPQPVSGGPSAPPAGGASPCSSSVSSPAPSESANRTQDYQYNPTPTSTGDPHYKSTLYIRNKKSPNPNSVHSTDKNVAQNADHSQQQSDPAHSGAFQGSKGPAFQGQPSYGNGSVFPGPHGQQFNVPPPQGPHGVTYPGPHGQQFNGPPPQGPHGQTSNGVTHQGLYGQQMQNGLFPPSPLYGQSVQASPPMANFHCGQQPYVPQNYPYYQPVIPQTPVPQTPVPQTPVPQTPVPQTPVQQSFQGHTPQHSQQSQPPQGNSPQVDMMQAWMTSMMNNMANMNSVSKNERRSPRDNTPVIPRNLVFHGDGEDDWKTFRSKFQRFMDINHINEYNSQVYHLSLMLKDKASKYWEELVDRYADDNEVLFSQLVKFMEKRFGDSGLDQTILQEFNAACQTEGQSIEDFRDQVWRLADRAHPKMSHTEKERLVVAQFSKGLLDKRASHHVMLQNCKTVEEAFDQCRLFKCAAELSNVDPSYSSCSNVATVSAPPQPMVQQNILAPTNAQSSLASTISELSSQMKKMENRIVRRLDDLDKRVTNVEKDLRQVRPSRSFAKRSDSPHPRKHRSNERNRDQSKSPSSQNRYKSPSSRHSSNGRSESRSPSSRTRRCYNCGSDSHLQYDCPDKKRVSYQSDHELDEGRHPR